MDCVTDSVMYGNDDVADDKFCVFQFNTGVNVLSLGLIGTVHAEPETVISRAWVQSPYPAE